MKKPATRNGAKGVNANSRPPHLTYPIPDNGKTLRTEHLHQLALLAIRQSAMAAQAGACGLYVPTELKAGDCNVVTFPDNLVKVENLSVLTSSGIAIRAQSLETELGANATKSAVLTVFWALPEIAISPEKAAPLLIGLSLSEADNADATEILGRIEIGDGPDPHQWFATAPLVTLGATPETNTEGKVMVDALGALGDAVAISERIPLFTRLLVRASLKTSGSQLMAVPTTTALASVSEAVMSCFALMRAFGTNSDAKLAQEIEVEVFPPAGNSAEEILAWIKATSKKLGENEALRSWLRGAVRRLSPVAGFPIAVGGAIREFRYAVPEEASQQLRVSLKSSEDSAAFGALIPVVSARFGGAMFRHLTLEPSEHGFTATVEPEGKGSDLELRVPNSIEPIVTLSG